MKILHIKAMNGPNYWSIRRHKLIVMKLDLEEMEHRPSNTLPGFNDRLKALFPSMYAHRCSEGVPGGFFMRVEDGTWMGHIIEHIALEIQTLAGMETGFGRTRGTGEPGIYNVVFAYLEEAVGRYAAEKATDICQALIDDVPVDLAPVIQHMRELREEVRLGPSTGSIVEEAERRGIPWIRLNKRSLVQLGYGVNQRRIQATVTSNTGTIGVDIAKDKELTKALLDSFGIAVPKGQIVNSVESLQSALRSLGFPVVVKPVDGNHGRGATINIQTVEEAIAALEVAQRVSNSVIVEKYITGDDYRFLVIDYRFRAAARRTPAAVVGNGTHTIQQLIDIVNADPRRGYGHEQVLTQIKVEHDTLSILHKKGYTLETVLPEGEELWLKTTANLSTGGTATDVTDDVHPANVFLAERIARIVGLDICGIDIIASDVRVPINEVGGSVIEVNAGPGFRMHLAPTEGLARNVAESVVDMLYPVGASARIPIFAITGTNGKTTTTRLLSHIQKSAGYKVGFTTTDGIYIQNQLLQAGDCTGPVSAEFVLKDPTVNCAVLECARGGILKAGLGFHRCDVGIVTNVAADHLGLQGINDLEDMSRVKAVIPESVRRDGYAVLNADDDNVYAMRRGLKCHVAFYSIDATNPRILRHLNDGGIAAVTEQGYLTICKGSWKLRVSKAVDVPITMGGKADFMIMNCLAAILGAFVHGTKLDDIRYGLETFVPSPSQTPGRMNMFSFKNFKVMIDYAHNPAGFRAIGAYLSKVEDSPKIGIVAGVGDRRDEDIRELGMISAQIFDQIVVRHDRNLRGRPEEELNRLIIEGIQSVDPNKPIKVMGQEKEAIAWALEHAPVGALIVICSDVVPDALQQIIAMKEMEERTGSLSLA